MRDQLIGHLVVGMVIVFKPDPKYMLGSCDTPAFIHDYKVPQFVNRIQRVCYVMLLQ